MTDIQLLTIIAWFTLGISATNFIYTFHLARLVKKIYRPRYLPPVVLVAQDMGQLVVQKELVAPSENTEVIQ